ncbi:hypothetical protein OB920_13340 [Halobacteria archaeon HArc-gm2]|nr:hypothetical protein [Halobacteria archaeon HArc-gm2]
MTDDPSEGEDSADAGDPFDRLGYPADRDGDPFERLDDDVPADDGTPDAPVDDPWVPPGEDRRGETTGEGGSATGDDSFEDTADTFEETVDDFEETSDPFANVATPSESAFEGAGNVFERVDAGAVDPDQVWESITAEDDDEASDDAEPSVPDEGRYSDVSKHRFCEGCEHFSPPPDVSCGHHTAEIIEFLDMDTVRLLDCPVVAERDELERSG